MKSYDFYNIHILPDEDDKLFAQADRQKAHTPYEIETLFYSYIERGNNEKVNAFFAAYRKTGITIGLLSRDDLKQMQYWAVSCTTLACRAAIRGGVDESAAYNASDVYIRHIDKLKTPEKIIDYLAQSCLEWAKTVAESEEKGQYPPAIKTCTRYIRENIYGKITTKNLADKCGLTTDYLSVLFKKTVGMTATEYILKKKLDTAKLLLNAKCNCGAVGYRLAFCSESYFIACFKKQFGMTPKQYCDSLNY
ncbi:MAG: AraC family transcriptional regulator [Clostridiales bacterium]|jgi:YesN/AraC family two-component response regulator|nr:AraC family transcriptional regulator [Clostridiales bacterium]